MTGSRLTPADRAALLVIARASLEAHFERRELAVPESGALAEPRGAFVTLHARGELRGCVGTFTPKGSLARTVAEMAVSAAVHDPRFPPLDREELAAIACHLSVLSPRRPIKAASEVVVGVHGLLVSKNWHRGTLLPRVAVEQGWDAEAFLKHTCLKAGLPASAWRESDTVIEVFEAEEFGDGATG